MKKSHSCLTTPTEENEIIRLPNTSIKWYSEIMYSTFSIVHMPSLFWSYFKICIFFISEKEIMFSVVLACLSVCLFVTNIINRLWMDSEKIKQIGPGWQNEQKIKIWWWSTSRSGLGGDLICLVFHIMLMHHHFSPILLFFHPLKSLVIL